MNSNKTKAILTIVLSAVVLLGLSIWAFIKTPDEYSESEKRLLAQRPTFSKENIIEGLFAEDFEKYSIEQFPLRESFRGIKYLVSHNILNQKDYNKIYIADGHISKIDYPLNLDSISYATGIFKKVYDQNISGTNAKTYFCIVPDKNMYLAEKNGYLAYDYNKLYSVAKEQTSFATFIDIRNNLKLEDYYFTDTHWRQENIIPIAEIIASSMGATLESSNLLTTNTSEKEFAGVYANQLPGKFKTDKMNFLTSPVIENCNVTIFDYDDEGDIVEVGKGMYSFESQSINDQYKGFLNGPVPFITIENEAASTEKELIIFRDSFGSSLSPLLASGYSKITIVDLRYLPSDYVSDYLLIENQDILFICSTILLNSSLELK